MNPEYLDFETFRKQVKHVTGMNVTFDLMLKRIPPDEREFFIEGLYWGIDFPILIHNFDTIMAIRARFGLTPQIIYNFCTVMNCTLTLHMVKPTDMFDLDDVLKMYPSA